MFRNPLSRRDFVTSVGGLGAAWLLVDVTERRDAMEHALHQMEAPQPTLAFLTHEQAAEVEAFTSRIIPTDDTPGAREAGVVYFIDRALTTFAKDQQPAFTEGITRLAKDVEAKFPGQSRLAALTAAQQDDVLKSIEQTPFFGMMRFATLSGMFALPSYGGNRNFIGWNLMGHDTVLDFKPPFGWYDRPANRRAQLRGGN
jgi:gluconate 2-dehydrogenase gamma chain